MKRNVPTFISLSDEDISNIYKQMAQVCHYDRNWWSDELMKRLNNAKDEAKWKNWKKDSSILLLLWVELFWDEFTPKWVQVEYFTEIEIRKIVTWKWVIPERPKYSKEIDDLLTSIPSSQSITELLDYVKKYNSLIFLNEWFSFLWFLASIEEYLWAPKWFVKFYYPNIYELFFRLWRGDVDMWDWLYLVRHILSWLYEDKTQRSLQDKHWSLYDIENSNRMERTLEKQLWIWEDLNKAKRIVSWVEWSVRWILLRIK